MQDLKPALDLLGINFETVLSLSAMVMIFVSFLKAQIPSLKGIYTTITTLVLSLGFSFKMFYSVAGPTDWASLVITALLCWVMPAGGINLIENFRGAAPSKAFKK
jgi:hypothetical protein